MTWGSSTTVRPSTPAPAPYSPPTTGTYGTWGGGVQVPTPILQNLAQQRLASNYGAGFDPTNAASAGADSATTDKPKEPSTYDKAAAASLAAVLSDYGLDELVPIVDQWVRDGMTPEEVMLQLRDVNTPAGKIFDARFPAIQLRKKAGLAPISPAEYVAYERAARQLMESAKLPVGFYDSRDDFTQFLTNDVSIEELRGRVNDGFQQVAMAPPEVRDAFQSYFGANGDSALASFFLDRTRSLPLLQKYVEQAQVGGAGLQYGFHIGQDVASRIADRGVNYSQARSGFDTLNQMKPLFEATISERNNLSAENQGASAIFGLDQGQARQQIKQRLDERTAAFSGVGGAATDQHGAFGLGVVRD